MKRMKKVIVWFMTTMMIVGAFSFIPMYTYAQQVSFTLKIKCADGMNNIPDHYGVEYRVTDAEGSAQGAGYVLNGSKDGAQVTKSVSIPDVSIPEADYIKITVQAAGKDIYYNGKKDNSWEQGKVIAVSDLLQEYSFQLQDPQNQGDPGSEPGSNPNQQEAVDLTVNWTGDFADIVVGKVRANLGGSSQHFDLVECQGDNIEIELMAPFTWNFGSVTANGDNKEFSNDRCVFTIPKGTTSLSITATTVHTGKYTIQWAYDDGFGEDAKVEHGRVVMVSGATSFSEDGTSWVTDAGETVTVKLIPDYGYQVVGAKINGFQDLTANEDMNVFSFVMPTTQVHFKGVFTATADIVSNTSSSVSGASFSGNAVASTGGTAKMTVSNAAPSDTAKVTEEIDTTKSVQAVNITMDQLFYKNTADSTWTQNKTLLDSAAQVRLTVNQAANGYAVLRDHNGQVEEIDSNYDASTQTITFSSTKYSTYTLVPLKTSKNTYVEEENKSEAPSSTSITSGESDDDLKDREEEEIIRDIKPISVDKTAVTDMVEKSVPSRAYNMSAYKTVKGFVTGINKISNNAVKGTVSIYTDKPICFSKYILESIKKNNITLVYYFMHEGHLYRITIPAGADITKLLESNGFAGPLYVGKQLGTSTLIK